MGLRMKGDFLEMMTRGGAPGKEAQSRLLGSPVREKIGVQGGPSATDRRCHLLHHQVLTWCGGWHSTDDVETGGAPTPDFDISNSFP